ncbi:MAG: peptidase S58 family protein [Chloroflexi bacterium]|nr:MAG: peptidase S58 family protein [Chloroflexota bacterium]
MMISSTNNTLTAVPGIRVGHATNSQAATGCTVILCPPNTVGGVDQRGGGPGTRETDLLRPMRGVPYVNAIVLAGGSAFGLASATGVVQWLDERGIGHQALEYTVPIVPAAIVFDLALGDSTVRPDATMGYMAADTATDSPVEQGNIGVGTGCSVGKAGGFERATKGGLGSACVHIDNDLVVAALFAVNAIGEVLDEKGEILGGVRAEAPEDGFVETLQIFRGMARGWTKPTIIDGANTVIGVVATNAALTKEQNNKVAQMAHDGMARAIRPAHTMHDGDTIFSLSTGEIEADVSVIGAFAAEVTAEAIRNGVRHATTLNGVRAIN